MRKIRRASFYDFRKKTPALFFAAVVVGAPAAAQDAAAQPRLELAVTGGWSGGGSLGTTTAELTTPGGDPFELFRSSHRLNGGATLEAHLAFRLTDRLWAEASGAWTRGEFQTRITSDFEDVPAETITGPLSQYTLEGAAVWMFARRGRMVPFARGGAGWMRQLSEDFIHHEDGLIASAGGGVKYWLREGDGFFGRLALRGEVRLTLRSGGLELGDRARLLAPVVVGGLIVGR